MKIISKFKAIYMKEQFNPTLLGLFVNPFYFARKGLYKNLSEQIPKLNGKLIDIGCGSKPYKVIANNVDEYIGLEIDDKGNRNHSYADIFYDGKTIPCQDKEFDSVLSNQVFEHVFNPNEFLKEINRVTKMEGLFLITVPFIWDEHEQPFDYGRYSSFGIKHILDENGFEIVEHKKSVNDFSIIFQLINAYIVKITSTKWPYVNLLITFLLIAPFNIIGLLVSKILPNNNDLYLDNIVLAKKVRNV